ncbi:inactive tyrosine-protein kinase 7 isoform X1 [Tachysurus fulvidraco]|uniref:inactive tyrosine-protein kinase 7 isoform X1 n=1 Tax=Tachysurus fulvidraco TaxID=1234273 RepID=UPI001FEF5673|nr:inactive tyrosine-protein kinase 7 isoform X1 [Tachysurus fulvidraco]
MDISDTSDTPAWIGTRHRRSSQSSTSFGNMRRRTRLSIRMNSLLAIAIFCTNVLCVQSSSLHFSKEPQSQDALHGRSAILRCEVSEVADVQYSWLQNGQTVQDSERRFMEHGNLKFTAVDRHLDTGNFQCVAKSLISDDVARSMNASFNIKWLDSGPVTLKQPASVDEIDDAEQIVLECQINGHPRPNIKWYKDGVLLTVKDRNLTLGNPVPGQSGTYSCCARNGAVQLCDNSNFTLKIIDKTIPRVMVAPKDQVVFRNEEAVFHCQFFAKPMPVIEWFHESEPAVNKSRVVVYDNGTLRITQVKPRNTGRYTCAVHYGTDKQVQVEATLHIADIEDMGDKLYKFFSANNVEQILCSPPRGHPEPEVWWEKDGLRVPSNGRVHQKQGELIFNPIVVGDSGTYLCMAKNKAGQKRQEVSVTVSGPPEWVTRPQDTEMEEGQPGYLHCQAQATPPAQVIWYRNLQEISEEKSQFKLFPNGTLRINSVEVYDGVVYNCICKTAGGILNGQAKVNVLEKLKFTPPPQSPQCLQLDKEASVQCSATGRKAPTIHWTKADGSAIPSLAKQINGTLHFEKVRRTDAGNYTCIASNRPQGEIRAYVSLTVGVYTEFKVEPEYTTVYKGHTATLHCQATGDPQPYIQWIVKDKPLSLSSSRFQEMPNGSLIINDVTTADAGKYTCIAGNSCGIRHRVAELYVVEKPKPGRDSDEGKTPYKMIQTIGLSVGAAVAYIIAVLGLMFYCKKRRNAKRLQKGQDGEEPEMECLNGGAMQHNGQTTAEIQEEVALTNLETVSTAEKQHSNTDKFHFPRADLQTITTLGKGEFGEVFLAKARGIEESEEQTVVLVKSLLSRDELSQAEFRRQVDMFSKLNHTNVVRILGLCKDTEPLYMILEYIDLGDLKQFLRISKSKDEKVKPQPISTKTKVSICAQVAAGMEHLSNHHFVHKDLAARNCLISGERHVKVSALGLSKDVYNSEYYQHRQSLIPLRWLPAESVFENDYSTKSDVWAFGVLMWEVFSHGEMPYATLSHEDILEGLQAGTLKLSAPEACPSKVYKLMSRCWDPSPKERPSFSELIQALGEIPLDSKV